ncbi:MAG: MGMT family protein [Candidatus Odinarchaeia archaeon]
MKKHSDKGVSNFMLRVYEITSKIPKGYVLTYGKIAELLGSLKYARAVGRALNLNPFPSDKVPCHRVVMSSGKIGGYAKGVDLKVKMLIEEGVEIVNNKVNLKKHLIDVRKLF